MSEKANWLPLEERPYAEVSSTPMERGARYGAGGMPHEHVVLAQEQGGTGGPVHVGLDDDVALAEVEEGFEVVGLSDDRGGRALGDTDESFPSPVLAFDFGDIGNGNVLGAQGAQDADPGGLRIGGLGDGEGNVVGGALTGGRRRLGERDGKVEFWYGRVEFSGAAALHPAGGGGQRGSRGGAPQGRPGSLGGEDGPGPEGRGAPPSAVTGAGHAGGGAVGVRGRSGVKFSVLMEAASRV